MRRAIVLAALFTYTTVRADDRTLVHAELDPLTFANRGYGAQIGFRAPELHGVRLALASFSLHVPDALAQIGSGNDRFDERVEPSGALYALYYLHAPGENGFAFGASLRLLRLRFAHDDAPGAEDRVTEISPEAIAAYQWHPFHNGFYLQPWLALGVVAYRTHHPVVDGRAYDELPVSPFFTVNLGYELPL